MPKEIIVDNFAGVEGLCVPGAFVAVRKIDLLFMEVYWGDKGHPLIAFSTLFLFPRLCH